MKANFVYGPKLQPYNGVKKVFATLVANIIPAIAGCYWVYDPDGGAYCPVSTSEKTHWEQVKEMILELNAQGIEPTVRVLL